MWRKILDFKNFDEEKMFSQLELFLSVVYHLVVVERLPFSLENGSKSTPLHFLAPWSGKRLSVALGGWPITDRGRRP